VKAPIREQATCREGQALYSVSKERMRRHGYWVKKSLAMGIFARQILVGKKKKKMVDKAKIHAYPLNILENTSSSLQRSIGNTMRG